MLPFLSSGLKIIKGLTKNIKAKKNGLRSSNAVVNKTMAQPLNIPINSLYSPFVVPLPAPPIKQNSMSVNFIIWLKLLLPLVAVVLLFRFIFKR